MKTTPWLAALIALLAAVPGFAAFQNAEASQADAHTVLSDGIRASSDPSDAAWLTLFQDSTQLPRQRYSVGDFCFWGVNSPLGTAPSLHPQQYQHLKDANILGVRYDVPWYGVGQYENPNYNWYGLEENIDRYVQDGFSVLCVVGYTPARENGLHDRAIPPHKSVEYQVVDLSSGSAQLAKTPVIIARPDILPVVVTPDPLDTTVHTGEVITTNFREGQQPRCANWPVVPASAEVWVDEGSGYQLWTQVDSLYDAADGAKVYEFDRAGRVKFRANNLFWHHGKTPANGSKVKISYHSINKVYQPGTDYTLDHMTGQITRRMATITGGLAEENFSGPLAGTWAWMNAPAGYTINHTTAGHLNYKINTSGTAKVGHFLFQTLSGDGDFAAITKVTKAETRSTPQQPESQTGIMVYKDADNWFRYGISNDAGRPIFTSCRNGQVTQFGRAGELGFQVLAPRWITVRKSGDTWTCFTSYNQCSAPDGGYQWQYSFEFPMSFPIKVGLSSAGTDNVGVDIDQFRLDLPSMSTTATVRVAYDYLDTEPWTQFLEGLVGHFKDRVKYWELWNEPDQGWCWNGGQDLYALMLREGSKAVKKADPEAHVISGGYANGQTTHLNTIYGTIGNSWFEYVAWHPYLFSNKAPDAMDWTGGNTNGVGRTAMTENGDGDKKVFYGEIAASSGVLGAGGGMNERKQAEYAMRLFLHSKKLGWVKGLQWWPGTDLNGVGDAEEHIYGGHDGLFYTTGVPKPSYWVMRNAASNKGVLFDLVNYDSQSNPVPESRKLSPRTVVVGTRDRAKIGSIKVLTSLTATDASCKPTRVAARHIGQAGASPFAVTVASGSAALATEKWTVTATSPTAFSVTGAVSGTQGTASLGSLFTSSNGVVRFTVPNGTKAYVPGDLFEFETFAGDGFTERAVWTNDGSQSGSGDIVVNLPPGVEARYVQVLFTKKAPATSITIDEIDIRDAGGASVSRGKLYLVDGVEGVEEEIPDPEEPEEPEVRLALSGLPADPVPGATVHLTLQYQNISDDDAANLVVTFPVPEGTTYVPGSATSGGAYNSAGREIRWIVPVLSAGASGTVTFDVVVD